MKIRIAKKVLASARNGRPVNVNRLVSAVRRLGYENFRPEYSFQQTPHLWGLVTLYRGRNGEVVFSLSYKGNYQVTEFYSTGVPGLWVKDTLAVMAEWANAIRQPINGEFNSAKVTAVPGMSVDGLEAAWKAETDRLHEEYVNSPEYKKHQEELAAETARRQSVVDGLIPKLPEVVGNMDALLDWSKQFAEVADWRSLVYDKGVIIQALEAAGWQANAQVGNYAGIGDPKVLGEWIIGQVVNCLKEDMPPHPVTSDFVDRYKLLRDEAVFLVTNPKDQNFLEIANGAYVTNAKLPSGFTVPSAPEGKRWKVIARDKLQLV